MYKSIYIKEIVFFNDRGRVAQQCTVFGSYIFMKKMDGERWITSTWCVTKCIVSHYFRQFIRQRATKHLCDGVICFAPFNSLFPQCGGAACLNVECERAHTLEFKNHLHLQLKSFSGALVFRNFDQSKWSIACLCILNIRKASAVGLQVSKSLYLL